MKLCIAIPATLLALAAGTTALFDCNSNQHAFPPTTGKFVVHYTSIRDTELDGKPWIRICKPSGNGWSQVPPLSMDCASAGDRYTFGTGYTGLKNSITVVNGNGCNDDSSNLDGGSLKYGSQSRSLAGDDKGCGKRDHGISCEFDL
ncbi:hypothetical protein BDW74DRAFT_161321 [Aspergillus multicolor]|uniref:uncharacterized protein n=1 Tax=Aspergillus multicolor TaxID=41759 RepID=UPI003CCD5C5A